MKIGGIDQWITINGDDRRNPVVLNLHGGPAVPGSPFTSPTVSREEKELILVQWDQRGAGRTFARSGPSIAPTMTIERMTQDGIEVADYLRNHLHKRKIILTGGSWGSVLGIRMAHARPDLFYAYVGVAQTTASQADIAASYAWVHQLAQTKGDQPSLSTLDAVGPPPWHALGEWSAYRKVMLAYQAQLAPGPAIPADLKILSEYADDFRKGGPFLEGQDFTSSIFWGPTLSGLIMSVDLTQFKEFKIPIYFIKGEFDLTSPPKLARAWFDTIKAPRKKFYLVPDTGHNPSPAEDQLVEKLLLTEVRSIARK